MTQHFSREDFLNLSGTNAKLLSERRSSLDPESCLNDSKAVGKAEVRERQ